MPDQEVADMAVDEKTLRRVTILLAVGCGLSVANLYYAQPLLDAFTKSFGVSKSAAALAVTATQIGYAAGLVFVAPLGDVMENRKLATRVLLGTAAALALAASAPNLGVFLASAVIVGLTSVVAQVLVPIAAHLAPEAERGQVVGRVMSGLLLGILLARTLSSLVAAAFGWRTVYVASAFFMVALSFVLRRSLPERHPDTTLRYRALLRSVVELARSERVLRRRAVLQALMFGMFSAFWTEISYELISRHHLGQSEIGIFALVGAAGAGAAPLAGKLADRGLGRVATAGSTSLGALAMLLAGLGAGSLVLLAIAGVLMDLSVQMTMVLGQHEVYALRPEARARITTVYLATIFAGGAISSALSGSIYATWGWSGVSVFGGILPLVALVLWLSWNFLDRRVSVQVAVA